jgi:hypothetical protein
MPVSLGLLALLAATVFADAGPATAAATRPLCYWNQYDYKMGADAAPEDGKPDRFGISGNELCTGEMYYLSGMGNMQWFDWRTCWCWRGALFITGSGDHYNFANSFASSNGWGPIPPFHGINGRRARVEHVHEWYDFSTPGPVPGEGVIISTGVGDGEWW